MITARDIMTTELITINPDTEISRAAKMLLEKHINGLPVVNPGTGKLVGILCQSDLIRQQKKLSLPSFFTFLDGFIPLTSMKDFEKEIKRVSATAVSEVMTADPITVNPDISIHDVASLMVENSIHTLPVVENGVIVGIVGKEDVLKTLIVEEKE